MSAFARFDAFMGRFYDAIGTLVGLSIGLFPVGIALDLLLRRLELGNIPGLQEIIEYALFVGVFLGAPWVLRLGAHVRVDVLLSNLPATASRLLARALDTFGLLVCLLLVWFGCVNLSQAYAFKSMQMKYFNVPEWWLLGVFVACFGLLALEFASRLVRGDATTRAEASTEIGGAGGL